VAWRELKDVENWQEFLEMRGTITALESIIEFPTLLEDTAKQKLDEEENDGSN